MNVGGPGSGPRPGQKNRAGTGTSGARPRTTLRSKGTKKLSRAGFGRRMNRKTKPVRSKPKGFRGYNKEGLARITI